MPLLEHGLSAQFLGLELEAKRLRDNAGWHEQASDRRHTAFPRSRGAWVAEVPPFCVCPHHPVHLFLIVRLDAEHKVRRVETAVCEEVGPGELDELSMPFFLPDMETARALLTAALKTSSRAALRWSRSPDQDRPLSLAEVTALVGKPIRSAKATGLVRRFRLLELTDVMGEGHDFTAPGKPLELRVDFAGRITTAFFRPRPFDVVAKRGAEPLTRDAIRRHVGEPESHPAPGGDRFTSRGHVTVVEYDGAGAATQVTVMSPEVAP